MIDVAPGSRAAQISVVVPVYAGAQTIAGVVRELLDLKTSTSPEGRLFTISEILLVDDNGDDGSAKVIASLAEEFSEVMPVWLTRNFGQHAATIAGISRTSAEWVVTLDEDGQHDPRYIGHLLDACYARSTQIAYGDPNVGAESHGIRRVTSQLAKYVLSTFFGNSEAPKYQSFRLIEGGIARDVASRIGPGAFLDVVLGWSCRGAASVSTPPRDTQRPSSYSMRRLIKHFSWLVITTGMQGFRLVSILGALSAIAGVALTVVIVIAGLFTQWYPEGWASTYVTYLLGNGAVLLAIGIVAEYIGVLINNAFGRQTFVIAAPESFAARSRYEEKETR